MKKITMTGRTIMMALSFFAFMILGTVSADAQWVNTTEAITLIKAEINTLDTEFEQATTDEQRLSIANAKRYYISVYGFIADEGQEIPTAIESGRLTTTVGIHSSGLIYFSDDAPDFKIITQGLVDEMTDLLSE